MNCWNSKRKKRREKNYCQLKIYHVRSILEKVLKVKEITKQKNNKNNNNNNKKQIVNKQNKTKINYLQLKIYHV